MSIILSNIRRWTRLWSRAVFQHHGWRTAAISHELQNVLSHELQNGPCRKTFEWEYLEIFIKLWFLSGIIAALRLQYQYGNTLVNCLVGMDKSFIIVRPNICELSNLSKYSVSLFCVLEYSRGARVSHCYTHTHTWNVILAARILQHTHVHTHHTLWHTHAHAHYHMYTHTHTPTQGQVQAHKHIQTHANTCKQNTHMLATLPVDKVRHTRQLVGHWWGNKQNQITPGGDTA